MDPSRDAPAQLLLLGVQIDDQTAALVSVHCLMVSHQVDGNGPKTTKHRIGTARLDQHGNGNALRSFALFLLFSKLGIRQEIDEIEEWVWIAPRPSPATALYDRFHSKGLSWVNELFCNEETAEHFLKNHLASRQQRNPRLFKAGWRIGGRLGIQVYRKSEGPEVKRPTDPNLTKSDLPETDVRNILDSWLEELLAEPSLKWRKSDIDYRDGETTGSSQELVRRIHTADAAEISGVPSVLIEWARQVEENRKWSHVPIFLGKAVPIKRVFAPPRLWLVNLENEKENAAGKIGGQVDPSHSLEISSILTRATHSVLIGEPGSGKSTFAKWLCAPDSFPEPAAIVICVILREYCAALQQHPGLSMLEFVVVYNCGGRMSEEALKTIREFVRDEENPCGVMVFDGWEEVPPDLRDYVRLQISQIRREFSTIVTCRPGAVLSILSEETTVVCRIGHLSGSSIRTLVKSLCNEHEEEGRGGKVLQRLDADENLLALAGNPLFLTMICQIVAADEAEELGELDKFSILQRVVRLLVCQQNSPDGPETDLDCLEEMAFQMSFGSSRKRYLIGEPAFASASRSRLLARGDCLRGDVAFVHSQLQEFLAAMRLSKKTVGELIRMLDEFGTCEEREEEWMFLFAAVGVDSEQGSALVEWWSKRLEEPDVFSEFHRMAARFFSRWKPGDGGFRMLGVDLREVLWQMIDRDINPGKCVKALALLDKDDLIRGLAGRLNRYSLLDEIYISRGGASAARAVISSAELQKRGLLKPLNTKTRFGYETNRIRLFPPDDLMRLRSVIRDSSQNYSRWSDAMAALSGYQDQESENDVRLILEDPAMWNPRTRRDNVFHETIRSATTNLAPRVAARILFDAFKMSVDCESRQRWQRVEGGFIVMCKLGPYKFLIHRKRELLDCLTAGSVPLAQYIIPEMLDCLKRAEVESELSKNVVKIVRRCRTGAELLPIVRLLESAPNIYGAYHLLKCFRHCHKRIIMDLALEQVRRMDDSFHRMKAYLYIGNSRCFTKVDTSWLLSNVGYFPNREITTGSIIALLSKCRLESRERDMYDKLALEKLQKIFEKDEGDNLMCFCRTFDLGYNYVRNLLRGLSNLSMDRKLHFKTLMLESMKKGNFDWCWDLLAGSGLRTCREVMKWGDLVKCVCEMPYERKSTVEHARYVLIELILDLDFTATLELLPTLEEELKCDFYRHVIHREGHRGTVLFDDDLRRFLIKGYRCNNGGKMDREQT